MTDSSSPPESQHSTTEQLEPPAPAVRRLTAVMVQGVWLLALPLLTAAVAFHVLLPTAVEAREGGLAALLAALGREQTLAVFVVLFLGSVAFFRYWGRRLPVLRDALAEPAAPKASPRASLRLYAVAAAVLAATLLFRFTIFQPYRVISSSMLPTLRPGDWIATSKGAYGLRLPGIYHRFGAQLPQRGDVIAFATPKSLLADELPDQLVKRVIGLPGDRIAVQNGRPIINGWLVPVCDVAAYTYISGREAVIGRLVVEFLENRAYLTVLFADSAAFAPYEVKAGEVFVLGDNRNNSSDSRSWNNGAGGGLPLHAIEGRVSSVLARPKLDGSLARDSFFKPLFGAPKIEGVDTSEIEAGLARCLKDPPKETTPPGFTADATAAR